MITNWKYNHTDIMSISDMQAFEPKVWGFVYHLSMCDKMTGELKYEYIGKKNIYTKRKRKFGKKETAALKDKRSKRYEYVIKESDWKSYVSSNKFIKKNNSKFNIDRTILMFCTNDMDLSFQEAKHIMCSGALESESYLNDGISIRRYGRKVIL